jgi:hypothetical protein
MCRLGIRQSGGFRSETPASLAAHGAEGLLLADPQTGTLGVAERDLQLVGIDDQAEGCPAAKPVAPPQGNIFAGIAVR